MGTCASKKRNKPQINKINIENFHNIKIEEIFAKLEVSPEKGLTSEQVNTRQKTYGPNILNKAPNIVEELNKDLPQAVQVLRDALLQNIAPLDLVPGDIIEVKKGEKVAADIRLFEAEGLKAYTGDITGEPDPIEKNLTSGEEFSNSPNILLFNMTITEGRGRGVVIATANNRYIAKIG